MLVMNMRIPSPSLAAAGRGTEHSAAFDCSNDSLPCSSQTNASPEAGQPAKARSHPGKALGHELAAIGTMHLHEAPEARSPIVQRARQISAGDQLLPDQGAALSFRDNAASSRTASLLAAKISKHLL